MPTRSIAALSLAVLSLGVALPSVRGENDASTTRLGKSIENVRLIDAANKSWALQDNRGKKATVVVFLSFECPVSTSYSQFLAQLAKTYEPKGVAFVGVYPGDDQTPAQIAKQARDFGIPFPVLTDPKLALADALKADITPEAFLLDSQGILRYRGRIDNGYVDRLKKNININKHEMREALDSLLAGQPIREPATKAVGCRIVREHTAKATGTVTFHRDVLPILQKHCQSCHRPGEVGPFALMNHRQAVNWAGDIKEYTQSRRMPPWKPVEGLAFHNERKLNNAELATLAAWVDGGTPEGDPKDAPPPRQFADGWQLGKPDLVLTVPEEFQVGPSGRDIFRCFVLPTNTLEDKYVVAVEVRPSNPRVVHHALLFIDGTGAGRKLEVAEQAKPKDPKNLDQGPGYSVTMGTGFVPQGALSGWAPGQLGRYLPEGTGYFLPKGADIVMQVHYHRDGRVEKDRTSIGLHFAKKPVAKRFQGLVLPGGGRLAFLLNIPAGKADHVVNGTIWVDQDCDLHSVMPHMHMVGKKIKVTMTPPEGSQQVLVNIDDWSYNWQETYFLKESIRVKAGTRFDVEAVYDNSPDNPNNPNDPPKNVRFGEQTTNEMCFVFLGATAVKPGRVRAQFQAPGQPEKK